MAEEIKYQLDKIQSLIEDIKRLDLYNIKQKLETLDDIKRKVQDDSNLNEIKDMLRDIKSRLESIESKIQK